MIHHPGICTTKYTDFAPGHASSALPPVGFKGYRSPFSQRPVGGRFLVFRYLVKSRPDHVSNGIAERVAECDPDFSDRGPSRRSSARRIFLPSILSVDGPRELSMGIRSNWVLQAHGHRAFVRRRRSRYRLTRPTSTPDIETWARL